MKKIRYKVGRTNTKNLPSLSNSSSSSSLSTTPKSSFDDSTTKETISSSISWSNSPLDLTKDNNNHEIDEDDHFKDRSAAMEMKKAQLKNVCAVIQNHTFSHYKSLMQFFKKCDKDGSGSISADEFHKAVIEQNDKETKKLTLHETKEIFDVVDKNKSGVIDYSEFVSLYNEPWKKIGEEHQHQEQPHLTIEEKKQKIKMKSNVKDKILDRITKDQQTNKVIQNNTSYLIKFFRRYDQNDDKVLTYKELRECLGPKSLNIGLTREEMKVLCEALDSDGNGAINVSEFVNSFHDIESKDKIYNPILESKVRTLTALKNIINQKPNWLDPFADVNYTFKFVTPSEILASPGIFHPPQLKTNSNHRKKEQVSKTDILDETKSSGFLETLEAGSPRQHLAMLKCKRHIVRSMSELTFGAKLTNKPENTAKPCLFAEMESPLAQLRGEIYQSSIFSHLSKSTNQRITRFQNSPIEDENTKKRLNFNKEEDLNSDKFVSTSTLFFNGMEKKEILPWVSSSILLADIKATKANKLRKYQARELAKQEMIKVIEDQFENRRLRTRSKLRFKYLENLSSKEFSIKPPKKIMDLNQREKIFGTSKQSMLFIPMDTNLSLVKKL